MTLETLRIPCGERTLDIAFLQDRTAGHGGVIWDAELCLAHYLVNKSSFSDPEAFATSKNTQDHDYGSSCAIELGAGTGLAGISLAMVDRTVRVLLTDKPALVPLLETNTACNQSSYDGGFNQGNVPAVQPFVFGASPKKLPREFHPDYQHIKYVLASDILGCGDEGVFDSILKTFEDLAIRPLHKQARYSSQDSSNPPRILMSYKYRAEFETNFFEKAAENFSIRLVDSYSRQRMESLGFPIRELYDSDVVIYELTALAPAY